MSVTRNSLTNVWDAIIAPPAFTERVSPEELQERIAEDTKNALEELLEENKDFFDARPVFSPSKACLTRNVSILCYINSNNFVEGPYQGF